MRDFGCKKADISLKYRLGLEHALAKADFLNVPDLVTVQAFAIFLFLVRRYESPTFVWTMTGLVIRIAQALGLHRDGSHFENFTPYEAEIRRRVWWALCALDVRASQDQGMDLTITGGSFDTKLPLNINDADIGPQTKETPKKRESVTDMTFAFLSCKVCNIVRHLLAPAVGKGAKAPGDQDSLLNEISENLNRSFLQHWSDDSENIVSWTAIILTRLIYAKMTLIIYSPVLFTSPGEHLSEELRTRLLISAIEVAEYNHKLNAEKSCRKWRWIYQTYTHWHAIVYLLLESAQRSWSPIVERAWVALHSSWLIPVQSKPGKTQRIWVPLQKLMTKARKHRKAELTRLKRDPYATAQLEMEDRKNALPASSGPFPAGRGKSEDLFREHWRRLVAIPEGATPVTNPHSTPAIVAPVPSTITHLASIHQQDPVFQPAYFEGDLWPKSNLQVEPTYLTNQDLSNTNTPLMATAQVPLLHPENSIYNAPVDWGIGQPLLWAAADPSVDFFAGLDLDADMELDQEFNWYNWVESAKGMEWNTTS
jgi:hypothetical protein